jgi:hypothetical protein
MPSAVSIYLHPGEGPDWQAERDRRRDRDGGPGGQHPYVHRRADRVVMLDRGQVVASGCHADLVAAIGPYAQFIATQRRHV